MDTKKEHIKRVESVSAWIKKNIKTLKPDTAIIMGSGLSDSIPPLENKIEISYDKIPNFLKSTVAGHAGKLLFGKFGRHTLMIMQGRFHFYEGNAMGDIAIPIRVMGKLGIKNLIVTAAVGSVNKNVKPGTIVVLKDHINMMGTNPLIGIYDKDFGPMFPDMTDVYTAKYRSEVMAICRKLKIKSKEGVYLAGFGPSYETPAEIKAFRSWGADVVGMSTVPEVIVARQMGIKIIGLSTVTNLASGVSKAPLSHQEVIEEGKKVAKNVTKLLQQILKSPKIEA